MAKSPNESRAYHHGNLKEALIEAGRQILEEEGLDKLSLRGVARRAGVSQTAPYHHFKDKETLLAAIAQTGFQDLAGAARKALKEGKSPQDQLDRYGAGYVEFAAKHPALFNLMFSGQLSSDKDHTEFLETASVSFELLRQCVAQVLEANGAPPNLTDIRTLSSWSIVHGLATLIIDGRVAPEDYACTSAKDLAAKMLGC